MQCLRYLKNSFPLLAPGTEALLQGSAGNLKCKGLRMCVHKQVKRTEFATILAFLPSA